MSHHEAAIYRDRADHLRSLASEMSGSSSMSLGSHAGVDTWFGPRADRCTGDLASAQGVVRAAIDDLLAAARRFEDTAVELDAAAWSAEREAARIRAELEAERIGRTQR